MHRVASGFGKSRSTGCIVASDASIHAPSQAQKPVALSTFEYELTALVLLIRNLLALRCLGAFLLDASLPTSVIHYDNMSVIIQLHKRDFPAHARHVRTNLGFASAPSATTTSSSSTSAQRRTQPTCSRRPRTATVSMPPTPSSRAAPPRRAPINKRPGSTNKLQLTRAVAHDVRYKGE